MSIAISAGILLVAAIAIAALLATAIVESTLEVTTLARIEAVKTVNPILVATLERDNAVCVSMMLRADHVSARELEVAYCTEREVSVSVAKKYGMLYEDPATKTIVLSIDGAEQAVATNNITNTICNLLRTNEAAIIWFCAKEQVELCPDIPVLLVLKTPQAKKLVVELKSPKTPAVRVRVR